MVDYAREGAGGALLPHFFQWCVLKILPYSPAVSRIPALFFGVGSTVLAWCLARQLRVKYPQITVLLFIGLPILFRYTLEARPYSQGEFFCCWALLLVFQLDERPSIWRAFGLVLVTAAGLYSQPFVIFELVSVALLLGITSSNRTKCFLRLTGPVLASMLLYLPWYFAASRQWNSGLAPSDIVTVFDAKLPLRVLREYTGGGYVVGICFLLLAGLGYRAVQNQRQRCALAVGFVAGIILPLFAEQHLHYFYAARHLMFALPTGVLLCAFAFESVKTHSRIVSEALLAVLAVGSVATIVVKETRPGENWQKIADRLNALQKQGTCVMSVRPKGLEYYQFFQPSLRELDCTPASSARAVLIADPYTPGPLLLAKSTQLEHEGYTQTRNEDVNGFQLNYFLLRGNQALADRE